MKEFFRKFATKVSQAVGSPYVFVGALFIVVVWALVGPIYNFSDTWQLVINTGTTISTFLVVFLIQNTQNRDGQAVQLKLDELIRATRARDSFIDIEDLSDDELKWISDEFKRMHERADHVHPAVKKLHDKLERAHHRRQGLNARANQVAEAAGDVAGQVVSLLNRPLGGDDDKKHHK